MRKPDQSLRAVFPCRQIQVQVPGSGPIDVKVYPLGVVHIREFSDAVARVIARGSQDPELAAVLSKIMASRGEDEVVAPLPDGSMPPAKAEPPANDNVVLLRLAPIAIAELLPLINRCLDGIDIEDEGCPHWVVAPVIEAWISESFGDEKKVRPWADAVDAALEKMTGRRIQLWQTLSSSLRRADTQSATS